MPGLPGPGEMTIPRSADAGVGREGLDAGAIDGVVAQDAHIGARRLERLYEVEGERVVVVDDEDHAVPPTGVAVARGRGRRRGRRRDCGGCLLDRAPHRGGLVLGLLELALGDAAGNDAGTGRARARCRPGARRSGS